MPALTPVVDSLDKVPEAARSFYEPKEGKFVLSLDATPAGFVPAADLATANGKVVEFRDKNILLLQEVEPLRTLKTSFDGIDPTAAKEALAQTDALKKKGVAKPDDVTSQIQAAVAAAVKPLQDEVIASRRIAEENAKRADDGVLRTKVGEKFLKAGGKPNALDFVLGKATEVFKVEGGEVKALANKFSSNHPSEPLGIEEWVVSFAKDNDFAFAPSTGAGAAPVRAGSSRAGQSILLDPSPQQLGEESTAKAIAKGELRIEYSKK